VKGGRRPSSERKKVSYSIGSSRKLARDEGKRRSSPIRGETVFEKGRLRQGKSCDETADKVKSGKKVGRHRSGICDGERACDDMKGEIFSPS